MAGQLRLFPAGALSFVECEEDYRRWFRSGVDRPGLGRVYSKWPIGQSGATAWRLGNEQHGSD